MDLSALVSVIVPVYKVEDYLDRAVQSIVDQSYGNLEIILVDDGSPDRCPAICDAWAQRDPRIRVIHKESGGVSSARNAGLRVAVGDWISFVDSDDWIHPQFFELLLLQTYKYPNADIIVSDMQRVTDDTPFRTIIPEEIDFFPIKADSIFRNRTIRNYVWGKIYRAKIVKTRSFDESVVLGEDSVFNAQIFTDEAVTVYYAGIQTYYYFQRESSAVHQLNHNQLIALQKNYIELASREKREYAKSFYLMEAMKRALSARYGVQFDPGLKETKEKLDSVLLSSSAELRALQSVSFRNKLMYTAFSYLPFLYRLCRIINDPTLIQWEKDRRKQIKRPSR